MEVSGVWAGVVSAVNAVASNSMPHASGLDMYVPLWIQGRNCPGVAALQLRPQARDRIQDQGVVVSFGSEVQAVPAAPKFAVAELQVQPAYQVSFASFTAPTCVVASKAASIVFGSVAVTAVSFAPLMNGLLPAPVSDGVNAALLFVPALNVYPPPADW